MPVMRKLLALLALAFAACATTTAPDVQQETAAVSQTVDAWHKAAADADEGRYFGLMTADAVFLGTDATERWNAAGFREFAHPYFAKGKAWTFVPHDRHVMISPAGDVAWFDEKLDSASYGDCRGSGRLGLVDDDLGQAVAVAQVDEYEAAVVAPAMNPAGNPNLTPGVPRAQLAARDLAVRGGKAERCFRRDRAGLTHAPHRTGTVAEPGRSG